jgi:aspartate racemase
MEHAVRDRNFPRMATAARRVDAPLFERQGSRMADADKMLGVLGGMGPLASAEFMVRLTLLTPAVHDQDHIPAVLWSDPRVPPRTRAHAGGEDPLPCLLRGVAGLRQAGATAIVIPCNTAHLWYEPIRAAAGVPVLHIVDAAIAALEHALGRDAAPPGPVGVMGTEVVLGTRLYQDRLEARGWRCLVSSEATMQRLVNPAIALVKANRVAEAYGPLAEAVAELAAAGAVAVVLGCTEIPLGIQAGPAPAIPVIDTTDALARAAVAWWLQDR